MSAETGTLGWAPFWCDGRFATIQCDFICMVSPEQSRRFILPALEEEAEILDHCVYHFDGPNALPQLDDILGIRGIDVIQWVSGAGQPPMHTWLDVLRRCLKAGQGLHLYGIGPEEARALHRELGSGPILYDLWTQDAAEVEDLLRWFRLQGY
jgi:5-methyltetrahydrofolate--homocysteine methyltransferase